MLTQVLLQSNTAPIVMELILASTSQFRKSLMERFGYKFKTQSPDFDENLYKAEHPNLSPEKMVGELAKLKGQSLLALYPEATLISADQIAVLNQEILHKPGTPESNFLLLKKLSGETHFLHTSFCVFHKQKLVAQHLNTTLIRFHKLSDSKITDYIERDEPWMCAGGYKIEKSGLSLIEKLETTDPSAIEGLPMMKLCEVLETL